MRFDATNVDGAFIIDVEPRSDDRGMFARAFCSVEFSDHGIAFDPVQANISSNIQAGTTRGLHFQDEIAPEGKLFRCIRGETFHVAVDVRRGSRTFGRWVGVRLSAENRRAFYVPPLCAAGYQALADGAEVLYLTSGYYTPEAEHGLRPDDPAVGIKWPLPLRSVTEKDRSWPPFEPAHAAVTVRTRDTAG
jgi:dTDP-4-dehydrorhamnose 3,5-epimerase